MGFEQIINLIQDIQKDITKMQENNAPKADIDALKTQYTMLEKSLNDLILKANTFGSAGKEHETLSIGRRFTQSDVYKNAVAKNQGCIFEVKTVDDRGNKITPVRQEGLISLDRTQVKFRDFMTVVPCSEGSVDYVVETGFVNNAGKVAEGVEFSESTVTYKQKTVSLENVGHYIGITKQTYNDSNALAVHVEERVIEGVEVKENEYIVNALTTCEGIQTYTGAVDGEVGDTPIDNIRRAITKCKAAKYPVEAIIVNPADFEAIETAKDNNGNYVYFQNAVGGVDKIWRVPLFEHDAVPKGKFLMGAIKSGACLYDRQQIEIEVATQHADNFLKGLYILKGDERIAVVVNRPESFLLGTFGSPLE